MAEFQFNITPCVENGKSELDSPLVVRVSFAGQPALQIEVKRSVAQVQTLLRDLNLYFGQTNSVDVAPTADKLEFALNQLVASNSHDLNEPWTCQVLMVFLDNAPLPSFFNNATFQLMKNKIKSLDITSKRSLQQVEDLQTKYFELIQQVQVIQQWMQIQHHEHPHSTQRSSAILPASSASSPNERHGNFPASSSDSDSAETCGHQLPVLAVSKSASIDNDCSCPNASTQVNASSNISGNADLSLRKPSDAGSHFNAAAPEFSPSGSSKSTVVTSPTPGVFPSSPFLPSAAYAQIATEDPLNRAMEELVVAISPQQAQVQYRDSIVALLQRNIRNVLNCEAFEVGLHRLLCFLPDDPVKVSAVVCRNHSTKWHRVICDRLNLVAKRKSEELAGEGYTYRTDRPEEGSEESSGDHIIRNVVISNTKLNILVQCSIDHLEVELTCNSRADVCMLALLEEIAMLVGKNDLFQRSLQAVRAWWNYECAAYVGTSIKYYLSDFAVCLMVAAIFNQHHTRINTPLQALCAFLAEYSQYDGTSSAITLMGIVPFKSATSNQPVLAAQLHPAVASAITPNTSSTGGFLLGPEALERYWLLFCPPDASNPEQQQLKIFSALSSSSEDVQGMDLAGVAIDLHVPVVPNSVTANAMNSSSDDHTAPSLEEAALASHRQACARNLAKFDRSQFNIVDPFTCNNMLVERPSQNRIARLVKVFQTGAQQLFGVLTQLAQRPSANPRDTIGAFFPQTTARFMETLVRPDTFNIDSTFIAPAQLAMLTRKIPMKVSIEDLARQMRYCNLMVESVISRSAVLDLVVEILTQKGPLPIGEVGKALAELTCITGLSSRLKEAYGGLKKFLEDFSSVVIIGTDHPFNPHIVLRSSLSAENLAMNDSGVFPTNVVLRMKKITATSLRKTSFGAAGNKLAPQQGMNLPQHPAYRSGGPALAGVGIGGIVDNRSQLYNQGPRHSGTPQPFAAYPQQQQQLQQQGQGQGQGQGNIQQMNHSGNSPQYTYNAKILSNMHADARDREAASGVRAHAIQNTVYSGTPKTLERRPSGGSHSGHAYGTFAENGGRSDPYDDVLKAPPTGPPGYHPGHLSGNNANMDAYSQRSPPPYHDSSPEIRMRMQSFPHPSPPSGARPMQPPQQQQQQMPRGYGPPEQNGFAHQAREFYHNQQQQQQQVPQMQQPAGRTEFAFEGPQHGRNMVGGPGPNLYGTSARGDFPPASPSTSSQGGFAMDSYFDAPLNDSFSQSGLGSRPSSIRSTLSTPALPARFDDSLDLSLFQGLSSGNSSSNNAGLQGPGQGQGQGARSLLSGLRQGTVELLSESHGQGHGQGNQGWDQFQTPQATSPDWRGGDRKY